MIKVIDTLEFYKQGNIN
jgi:hypothetical protein